MAIQLNPFTRTNRLQAIETSGGTTPKFQIRTGAQPANCDAADSGTLLVDMTLPSDWAQIINSAGPTPQLEKVGTWQALASASGVAGHFRIKQNPGGNAILQGSVGQGSGDLSLDNTTIASGQQVTINTFLLTDGNG